MKRAILIFFSSLLVTVCFAQTSNSCDTVRLNNEVNIKNAEPCVLIAADYVLSQPLHGNSKVYHEYRSFILSWMEKTPDYTFSLNDKMMAICKEGDNLLLFGVYTTCLSKAAVQLKKDFNTEAIKLFVDFVKKPENKVKQTSKIKKLIEDFNANKIDKYIN